MDDESDHAEPEAASGPYPEPTGRDAATVERYETDDGVVLYDADDPLAWVKSDGAVALDDAR